MKEKIKKRKNERKKERTHWKKKDLFLKKEKLQSNDCIEYEMIEVDMYIYIYICSKVESEK